MKRQRQIKVLSIVVLVVAIIGMSLGFSAFSTTLNITSSASVTPNSSDFKVVFSGSKTETGVFNAFGVDYVEEGLSISLPDDGYLTENSFRIPDMTFLKTDRKVKFYLYAHNIGKYDAYLKDVNISNVSGSDTWKVCTPTTTDDTRASDSLVQAACEGIDLSVEIDDVSYELNQENISGVLLEKGGVVPVAITIYYKEGSQLPDGEMLVSFGNISLEYGSADNDVKSY